jgi:tRNA U34 5-carboxymethylaminomethyl modifying GTPase MnmE/TrmE
MDEQGLKKIGFLTQKDLKKIDEETLKHLRENIKQYPNQIIEEKKTLKLQTKASHELEFQIKQKKQDLDNIDPSITTCHACNQNLTEQHTHDLILKRTDLNQQIKVLQSKYEKIYGNRTR